MPWVYIICFALVAAGLLTLFGVRPGDFIDALFRSQRKSATLTDELNVLMGIPAKGFFNQDFELKQILKGTGRTDRYEAVKRLSLILFAVGGALALLIGNVYMVPILGIGFSLAPIWYLRSTAASYKKHLNEELETAISIITTSYLRTEDLIRAVKRNAEVISIHLGLYPDGVPLEEVLPGQDSLMQEFEMQQMLHDLASHVSEQQMKIVRMKGYGYGIREISSHEKIPMKRIQELLDEVHAVFLRLCRE